MPAAHLAADAIVIFDITREPFDDWKSGPFLLMVAAIIAAITWLADEIPGARIFGVCVAIVAIVAAPFTVYWNWREHNRLRALYTHGDYELVEGVVSNFQPDDWRGSPQHFDVEGRRFVVSRLSHIPGFQNTVVAGGPNLSGQCVRIAATPDNEILWLGVLDAECQTSAIGSQ
ncbi:MAG TPA: hypothetical protein PKY87_07960 [Terricaulis sp.]|nr:hypothetical protein [Terricaulis sp.]